MEGDTIIGAKHHGAILSYVDRCSKFTILEKRDQKTAQDVSKATILRFNPLPHKVHTITYDNGKEFAQHVLISQKRKSRCSFAKPYHGWEHGLNEHTNGLIREYISKSSSIVNISVQKIKWIENKLNHRPRKVLKYKTPFEVFYSTSSALIQSVALQC